jgi:cell division protein FtsB
MNTGEKILFIVAISLALSCIGYSLLDINSGKQEQIQSELASLLEKNRVLEQQNHKLSLEVKALEKGGEYLEKVIRRELGLIKEDELIFQLPDIKASK